MKTNRQTLQRALLISVCSLCLLGIPACVTFQHATPEAPFVISFEFIKPFTATPIEERRFITALEKYAVRSLTRIRVGKIVIWPPPLPPIGQMKTDRITKAERASADGETRGHPQKTDNANIPADDGNKPITDRPTKTDWGTNRPAKTDHIAFSTEQDLRDFVGCVVGKGCPDRATPAGPQ